MGAVLQLKLSIKDDLWKKSALKWNCAVHCTINTEIKCEQIRQGAEWTNNPFYKVILMVQSSSVR